MESVQLTTVFLLNVPLENDYKHTLYFESALEQNHWFRERPGVRQITDFSYQRKEGIMRIPLGFEEAVKYNYVIYRNKGTGNKYYYAFITNYEYKGDDQTNITLETDVIQTYMFDIDIKPSFIEREHVDDDTVGKHTIQEGLEIGEYVCKYRDNIPELQDCCVLIGATIDYKELFEGYIPENVNLDVGHLYNGIYSGALYYCFKGDTIENDISGMLKHCDEEGKGEAITSIFMLPSYLINGSIHTITDKDGKSFKVGIVSKSSTAKTITYSLNKNVGNETYTPKNNKLNCYPYKYLLVSNNNGGSAIYQYEHFANETMKFSVSGCITPGGSIRLVPQNYKGIEVNDEEGLNHGKYPICNWSSDVYTNWLTQNSVNIGLNIASGVGQIIVGGAIAVGGSAVTGGMAGVVGASTIVGGVTTIAQQMAQTYQMSFTPPQSKGNTNCGDIVTVTKNNTFFFHCMSAKDEYLKTLDEYFSMFGYKCHRVKVPNKNHRSNWWFTKTVDANILGTAVPIMDLIKIKKCYDEGITFWKNPNTFKDYSQDNNII